MINVTRDRIHNEISTRVIGCVSVAMLCLVLALAIPYQYFLVLTGAAAGVGIGLLWAKAIIESLEHIKIQD